MHVNAACALVHLNFDLIDFLSRREVIEKLVRYVIGDIAKKKKGGGKGGEREAN